MTLDDGGPFDHRVQNQIIYMPTHINRQTDLPPRRYYHANLGKQRSKRSNKSSSSQIRQNAVNGKHKRAMPRRSIALSAASSSSKNHRASLSESFSSQSSSSPPASVLSSSSMLSSSKLTSQMNPPYVSGPSESAQQNPSAVGVSQVEYPSGAVKNITAQVGHPVYMHCVVETIGDKMVCHITMHC